MTIGLRHLPKGLNKGMGQSTQLNTQADLVTPVAYIVSGVLARADNVITLNDTTPAIEMTIAHPDAGRILVIRQIDAGTAGHTVTLTAGTFDLTGNNIATFNSQYETLVLLGISDKRFLILMNHGAVGLSGA